MLLLSAAMIVKNEERFLAGCLDSLRDIVDEVVVVDTGSTDATIEIARDFGARVFEFPWTGDFSAARNVSLGLACGRWILYIDADERLTRVDRGQVESLLDGAEEMAFRVFLRPVVGSTPYREYRLWRNDPRIRFSGVIHEQVVAAIHQAAEEDGRSIGLADLFLEHLGYEGDQTHKHHRNLPLLERLLADHPENLFAWHHLARVLDGLGRQAESEQALVSGVEHARRMGSSRPVAALSYGDLIGRRLARGEDPSDLLQEAVGLFPDNCVILWHQVRWLMGRGEFAAAVPVLERILGFDWRTQSPDGPAYSRRLVGDVAWDAKGTCHLRLGEFALAADAYARAETAAPPIRAYRVKRRLAEAKARARAVPSLDLALAV